MTFLFLRCRVIKALWYLVLLVIKGGGHARPFFLRRIFHEGLGKSDEVFRITKLIVSNAGGVIK
jgi:hypothetical protein